MTKVQSFSDSDLLLLYRQAKANLAFYTETTVNGRTVRRSDLPDINAAISDLESRIAIAADTSGMGGNVSLVTFDPPQ